MSDTPGGEDEGNWTCTTNGAQSSSVQRKTFTQRTGKFWHDRYPALVQRREDSHHLFNERYSLWVQVSFNIHEGYGYWQRRGRDDEGNWTCAANGRLKTNMTANNSCITQGVLLGRGGVDGLIHTVLFALYLQFLENSWNLVIFFQSPVQEDITALGGKTRNTLARMEHTPMVPQMGQFSIPQTVWSVQGYHRVPSQ